MSSSQVPRRRSRLARKLGAIDMKVVHREAYPPESVDGGIHRQGFPGLNTRIVVCDKGCVIPRHGHERSEEIYVISGPAWGGAEPAHPGARRSVAYGSGRIPRGGGAGGQRFLVANTAEPRA